MIAENTQSELKPVVHARGPQVGDQWLLYAVTVVVALGVLLVLDTSYAWAAVVNDSGRSYALRQAVYAVVGFLGLAVMLRTDYRRLRNISGTLLILVLVALCAVWLPFIGHSEGGAARWINLRFTKVQPSELAKIALVLYLARFFTDRHYSVAHRPHLFAPLLVLGLVCGLIEREPDLGTAIVVMMGGLSVFFAAGVRLRKLVVVVGALACVGLLVVAGGGYRGGRISVFLNPENDPKHIGLQAQRSGLAIGSGMLTGMGLGKGREKYYIPAANTDYIFATYAEETGFLGSVLLVGLYMLIAQRGFAIALRCSDGFGRLLAVGISTIISGQAALNLMVTTSLLPSTGVPLPLVSSGGSSLVSVLVSVGILLSIAHRNPAPVVQKLHGQPVSRGSA